MITVYPEYDARIRRSDEYEVRVVQGSQTERLTVYDHTEHELMLLRTVAGDGHRRFCEFAFSGEEVRVDITVRTDVQTYCVIPSARQWRTEMHDNVISVYLEHPAYFLLRLNGDPDSCLVVLADAPEDPAQIPLQTDAHTWIIDGWVAPPNGSVTLDPEIDTVYFRPGSVLFARMTVNHDHVKIYGRGMMLDPYSDIFHYDARCPSMERMLIVLGNDVRIEGIKLLDARAYSIDLTCSRAHISDVKVLCSMTCSDGVSVRGGENCIIEHCLIYNGDNCIVMGGGDGHIVRNCIFGTTCAPIFLQDNFGLGKTVLFENNFAFRCDEALIAYAYNHRNKDFCRCNTVIRNLSAVDVTNMVRTMWVKGVKAGDKNIRLENLAVNASRGTDAIRGTEANPFEFDIQASADDVHMVLQNYYVDGELRDAVRNARIDEASQNSTIEIAAPEGTLPFPAMSVLHQADFHAEHPVLPEPVYHGENLIADPGPDFSIWNEKYSYNVQLAATEKEAGDVVYALKFTAADIFSGMYTVVTDALKKYLSGDRKVLFSFDAKAGADTGEGEYPVSPRLVTDYNPYRNRKVLLGKEWRSFAITFDEYTAAQLCGAKIVHLAIINGEARRGTVLFRNMELKIIE